MISHRCASPLVDRRRHFWATQPDACGQRERCGNECDIPGLKLITVPDKVGLSIETSGWIRGLLLNILSTTAKAPTTTCGNLPGREGGHWSESYGDGTYVGTHMYESGPNVSFRDALIVLKAKVSKDVYKLVTYGVATSVDVATKYLGSNRVSIDITVIGPTITEGVVNLSVERIANAWVWK